MAKNRMVWFNSNNKKNEIKMLMIFLFVLFVISIPITKEIISNKKYSSIKKNCICSNIGYVYKVARSGIGKLDYNIYIKHIVKDNIYIGKQYLHLENSLPLNSPVAIRYAEEDPTCIVFVKDTILYSSGYKFVYKTKKKKKGIWAGNYNCIIEKVDSSNINK